MTPQTTSPLQLPMPETRQRDDLSSDFEQLNNNCDWGWEGRTAQRVPTSRSHPPRCAELTTGNLLLHTQSEEPGAQIIMPPASASEKSVASKSRADTEQALREFGVRFKTGEKPPSELLKHFREVVQRERGGKSPTAMQLARIYPSSSRANESTVVSLVAPYLLFEDMLHSGGGEPHVIRKDDINFDSQWVTKGRLKLATPRPDVSIGYILHKDLCGITTALFDLDEETVLLRFAVNEDLLGPFITCQMKSAFGAMPTADIQTTRDAIAIINAMFALLQAAGERPTAVDLHHWSVTCDGSMAHLWLHWAHIEEDFGLRHYMKHCLSTVLDGGDKRLEDMRMYLRNILEFACEERVIRLKELARIIRVKESAGSSTIFPDTGSAEGNDTTTLSQTRPPRPHQFTSNRASQRTPTRNAKKPTLESPKTPDEWCQDADEMA